MHSSLRGSAVAAATLILAVSWLPTLAPVASADSVTVAEARLPSARVGASAAWTGSEAYVFGGHVGSKLTEIVRYDPFVDEVSVQEAQLPTGREAMVAVWTGTEALVMGGFEGTRGLDEVVRYDPVADEATLLAGRLPAPVMGAAGIWDGTHVYLFGGSDDLDGTYSDAIVRYDPDDGSSQVMEATLPSPRRYVEAVWDGRYAYVFGGEQADDSKVRDVVRYDPSTDSVVVMNAQLPRPLARMGAAWAFGSAFLFGGFESGNSDSDLILRFDPVDDRVTVEDSRLPLGREGAPAVWTGTEALLFGGVHLPGFQLLDQIVRYAPNFVGPPRSLEAVPGPESGEVTLTWLPPAFGHEVVAYRIYSGTDPGAKDLLAEVDAARRSYTHAPEDPFLTSYYVVTALVALGEGGPSRMACTAPAPAHLLPSSQPACDAPPGWREREVLAGTPFSVTVTPTDPLLVVEGRPYPPDPRYYTLQAVVLGIPAPVVGVFTGGLVQAPLRVEVPQPLGGLEIEEATLQVLQRHDPARAACLVFVDTLCAVGAPLGDVEGVAWLTGPGARAEVVFEVGSGPGEGGDTLATVRVPMLGQLAAGADESAPFGNGPAAP